MTVLYKLFFSHFSTVTSLSPGQPSIVVTSQTATNISLSWSVPSGLAVDGSTVIWQAFTNNGSLQAEESGTTDLTTSLNYTLSTPDSCLLYAITIVVFGPGGNASQSLVIGTGMVCIQLISQMEIWAHHNYYHQI